MKGSLLRHAKQPNGAKQPKLMKGGGTPSDNSPSIIIGLLAMVVCLILFIMAGAYYMCTTKANTYKTIEIVTPGLLLQKQQHIAPVYPSKDPDYPLRGTNFQQVGVLVGGSLHRDQKEPTLLPLFGRKMTSNSDRWEYYCASDKYHMMKLPVMYEHRDCGDDTVGCNEIYHGQHVNVPDYGEEEFKARIYKYDKLSNFQMRNY